MSGPRHGVVEHVSSLAFGPTLQRLKDRIASAGMTVFACIDHAAGAREVGMGMPPTGWSCSMAMRAAARRSCWPRRRPPSTCPCACWCARTRTDAREAGVPDPLASRLEPAQHILVEAIATA